MEEKCPNGCIDGYIRNPYTHKKEICPFCKDKRKMKMKTGEVSDELKLPLSLCGTNYAPEAIIPAYKRNLLEADSVQEVLDKLKELIQDASLGVLPKESILLNFGSSCHDANFIAPYLKKAYEAGLTIAPVMSPADIIVSRRAQMNGIEDYDGIEYKKILSSKICLIVMDAGTLSDEIMAVKGVMQLRARQNLPTIIVTHVWNNSLMTLQACNGESCYDLATLYAVRYIKSGGSAQARMSMNEYARNSEKGNGNVGII